MRIDLNPGFAIPENQLEKNASLHSNTAAAGANLESRFSLSETSGSGLAAGALSAPEARLEKVEALKAQILAGTYPVSPEQVAGSVLEQMRVHSS